MAAVCAAPAGDAAVLTVHGLSPAAEQQILALNAAHEQETSPLDKAALHRLISGSWHLGLAGRDGQDGFLIALDETHPDYTSPNYLWFKARYPRFVYIDRVIIAPAARGQGVARALYDAMFQRATAEGVPLIGCEVNSHPPNPASDAFHAALGFACIGEAALPGGVKQVRYLAVSPER